MTCHAIYLCTSWAHGQVQCNYKAHSVCILHQFGYTTSGIKFMFEFLGIKAWVQGHLYPACMASSSRCANAVSNQLHFLLMNLLATELTCMHNCTIKYLKQIWVNGWKYLIHSPNLFGACEGSTDRTHLLEPLISAKKTTLIPRDKPNTPQCLLGS